MKYSPLSQKLLCNIYADMDLEILEGKISSAIWRILNSSSFPLQKESQYPGSNWSHINTGKIKKLQFKNWAYSSKDHVGFPKITNFQIGKSYAKIKCCTRQLSLIVLQYSYFNIWIIIANYAFFLFLCCTKDHHLSGLLWSVFSKFLPAAHVPQRQPPVPCSQRWGRPFPPGWVSKKI